MAGSFIVNVRAAGSLTFRMLLVACHPVAATVSLFYSLVTHGPTQSIARDLKTIAVNNVLPIFLLREALTRLTPAEGEEDNEYTVLAALRAIMYLSYLLHLVEQNVWIKFATYKTPYFLNRQPSLVDPDFCKKNDCKVPEKVAGTIQDLITYVIIQQTLTLLQNLPYAEMPVSVLSTLHNGGYIATTALGHGCYKHQKHYLNEHVELVALFGVIHFGLSYGVKQGLSVLTSQPEAYEDSIQALMLIICMHHAAHFKLPAFVKESQRWFWNPVSIYQEYIDEIVGHGLALAKTHLKFLLWLAKSSGAAIYGARAKVGEYLAPALSTSQLLTQKMAEATPQGLYAILSAPQRLLDRTIAHQALQKKLWQMIYFLIPPLLINLAQDPLIKQNKDLIDLYIKILKFSESLSTSSFVALGATYPSSTGAVGSHFTGLPGPIIEACLKAAKDPYLQDFFYQLRKFLEELKSEKSLLTLPPAANAPLLRGQPPQSMEEAPLFTDEKASSGLSPAQLFGNTGSSNSSLNPSRFFAVVKSDKDRISAQFGSTAQSTAQRNALFDEDLNGSNRDEQSTRVSRRRANNMFGP